MYDLETWRRRNGNFNYQIMSCSFSYCVCVCIRWRLFGWHQLYDNLIFRWKFSTWLPYSDCYRDCYFIVFSPYECNVYFTRIFYVRLIHIRCSLWIWAKHLPFRWTYLYVHYGFMYITKVFHVRNTSYTYMVLYICRELEEKEIRCHELNPSIVFFCCSLVVMVGFGFKLLNPFSNLFSGYRTHVWLYVVYT